MIGIARRIRDFLRAAEPRAKGIRDTCVNVVGKGDFFDGYCVGMKAYENLLWDMLEKLDSKTPPM